MPRLDDLLNEQDEKLSPLDKLLAEPQQKAKGLDALLQETAPLQSPIALSPSPAPDIFANPPNPQFQGLQDLISQAPVPEKPSIPQRMVDFGKQIVQEFPTMQMSPNVVTGKQGVRMLGTGELIRELTQDNTPKPLPPLTQQQVQQSIKQSGMTETGQAIPTQDIENIALAGVGFTTPLQTVGEGALMKLLGPRVGYAVSSALGEAGLGAATMGGLSAAEDISNAPGVAGHVWEEGAIGVAKDLVKSVDVPKAVESAKWGGLFGMGGGFLGGLIFGAPIVAKMNMIKNITGQSGGEVAGKISGLAKSRNITREAATDIWLDDLVTGAVGIQEKATKAGLSLEDYVKQTDDAIIRSTAKIDAEAGPMTFSRKIKLVAQKRAQDTGELISPQSINKELQKAAKLTGKSRGEILDEMYHQHFPDAPIEVRPDQVTKKTFEDVLGEPFNPPVSGEQRPLGTVTVGRNRAPLLPEGDAGDYAARMADALDRKATLDFTNLSQRPGTTTPEATYVGGIREMNMREFSDDEINRIVQVAQEMSPEFQIPNDQVAMAYLESKAYSMGMKSVDKYLARFNVDLRTTPEGQIRTITQEMMGAERAMGDVGRQSADLARRIRAGEQGLEKQYENSMLNLYKLLDKTTGVRSESGRLLRSFRSKVPNDPVVLQRLFLNDVKKFLKQDALNPEIIKRIANLDILDPIARQKFLNSLYHPTLRNYIDELWYNGLLSSPKTQIRNILGNIGAAVIREIERPLAAASDYAISVGGYRRPRERFFGESKYAIGGLAQGWTEGTAAAMRAWKDEIPQFGLGATKFDTKAAMAPAFKGSIMRHVRTPTKFLLAMDDFAKAINYRMELNAISYREAVMGAKKGLYAPDMINAKYKELIANPPEELIAKAATEAKLRTFTTESGEIGRGLIGLRNKIPAMEFLIPFLRTPLNIAEFGIERMPGLNLLSILNRSRQGIPINASEEVAKNFMGMATITAVALINKYYSPEYDPATGKPLVERITGQEIDPKKRTLEKIFFATGQQKYAINAGGDSYSYFNFEPASTILGMSSDYVDLWNSGIPLSGAEFWATAALKIPGQNITGKTFADGFETFFAAAQGDTDRVKRNLYRTIGSFIPIGAASLTRGISQAVDLDPVTQSPVVRETDSLRDAVFGNLPGGRDELLPVYDAWGRPLSTEGGVIHRMLKELNSPLAEQFGGYMDAIADPTTVKKLSDDYVNKEINRIRLNLPAGEGFPTFDTPDDHVKYIGQLPREQYKQYVETSGALAYERVNDYIRSSGYEQIPLLKKRDVIANIRTAARKEVFNKMFGAERYDKKTEYKEKYYYDENAPK